MEVIIASDDYDELAEDTEQRAAFRAFTFLVVPRELFERLRGETGVF